jgi:hypothetical protein
MIYSTNPTVPMTKKYLDLKQLWHPLSELAGFLRVPLSCIKVAVVLLDPVGGLFTG